MPTAGTSAAARFNENLQVDLSFSADTVASHDTEVFSKYSPSVPVISEDPQEAWGVFASSQIGIFGPPKCIQMDEWGARGNEFWIDFARSAGLNPFSEVRVRSIGFLNEEVAPREQFIAA